MSKHSKSSSNKSSKSSNSSSSKSSSRSSFDAGSSRSWSSSGLSSRAANAMAAAHNSVFGGGSSSRGRSSSSSNDKYTYKGILLNPTGDFNDKKYYSSNNSYTSNKNSNSYGGWTVSRNNDGSLHWSDGKSSYDAPGTSGREFSKDWSSSGKLETSKSSYTYNSHSGGSSNKSTNYGTFNFNHSYSENNPYSKIFDPIVTKSLGINSNNLNTLTYTSSTDLSTGGLYSYSIGSGNTKKDKYELTFNFDFQGKNYKFEHSLNKDEYNKIINSKSPNKAVNLDFNWKNIELNPSDKNRIELDEHAKQLVSWGVKINTNYQGNLQWNFGGYEHNNTFKSISNALAIKHEMENKGFNSYDDISYSGRGGYKEHIYIESSTNTRTIVREYADGTRRTVEVKHESRDSSHLINNPYKADAKHPGAKITYGPAPKDSIIDTTKGKYEDMPKPPEPIYKDIERYVYTFGIDNIKIAHKEPIETSGWISEEIEIGHASYIELSVKQTQTDASTEFYIIENNKEYPICPAEHKTITNEKLFHGLPTRFKPHPDYPITIYKNGSPTQLLLTNMDNIDFNKDTYTVSYTPIRQSYHFFPEELKIKIKVIERVYKNTVPSIINSITVLKHGGGKIWHT